MSSPEAERPKERRGILTSSSSASLSGAGGVGDHAGDGNGHVVSTRAHGGGASSTGPGSMKAVSIVEPESISPMMLAGSKDMDDDFSLDRSAPWHRRAKVAASKLKGRPADEKIAARKSPFLSAQSSGLIGHRLTASPSAMRPSSSQSEDGGAILSRVVSVEKDFHAQIRQWLEAERTRRQEAGKKRTKGTHFTPSKLLGSKKKTSESEDGTARPRAGSDASDGTTALDELEIILDRALKFEALGSQLSRRGSKVPSRKGSIRRLRRMSTTGSDTDYFDGVPAVPSCDANLDNSKTLSYSGGASDRPGSPNLSRRDHEAEAWHHFKFEIVRLAHTLRLKGWRRVTMEQSREVTVERLSGALTNAVYVVAPPQDVPPFTAQTRPSDKEAEEYESGRKRKPPPMKLLLRIYGPQVSHLIDREAELAILRRLALKKIGPKLLGTFTNGRFEEFLNAKALKPGDLRNKETSRQIAKRCRELHDGVELLDSERDGGPFVWKNWDKWVERCSRVVEHVDAEVANARRGSVSARRGSKIGAQMVCGTSWPFFRTTVEKYRKWLEEHYGGFEQLKRQLVFAHNDTQYGNILRVEPPGDSPLLLPANHHKQLVVIDFEYANANMPGLEFANHFTEWTYNYHDEAAPYACNTSNYPTLEEQRRFVSAYVQHRPQYRAPGTPGVGTPSGRGSGPGSDSGRPSPGPRLSHKSSTSSIPAFLLDARTPAGAGAPPTSIPPAGQGALDRAAEEEERAIEAEVQRLLYETKLWRLANSAQWVAWGIVQAKVSGLPPQDEEEGDSTSNAEAVEQTQQHAASDPLGPEEESMREDLEAKRPDAGARPEEAEEDNDEFDYLAYAHERALFFWGDALQMGLVTEEQLPVGLKGKLKIVEN